MRIAIVTTEFITEPNFDGGLSNYLFRLSKTLITLGHHPVIIVASNKDERLEVEGLNIYRVDTRLSKIEYFKNNIILRKIYGLIYYLNQSWKLNNCLRKIHQKTPFDLVQYTHLEGVGLFRLFSIPSIIRFSSFTPSLLSASKVKGRIFEKLLEKLAIKNADGLFSPSHFIANVSQEVFRKPVKVIESPFFIETNNWNEEVYHKYGFGKRYLLYFGTLSVVKGVQDIADILEPLLMEYPDLLFLFVGKDIDSIIGCSMQEYIYRKVSNFYDRVIILDKLPHSQLYPLIKHAFAVVLPSHVENLSNACLEAMGMGRIVIGTRGTSFEEIIDDGVNGFLCNVNNSIDLLRVLEIVINLPVAQMKRIEENALIKMQNYKPEIMVRDLIEYYQKILQSRKTRI